MLIVDGHQLKMRGMTHKKVEMRKGQEHWPASRAEFFWIGGDCPNMAKTLPTEKEVQTIKTKFRQIIINFFLLKKSLKIFRSLDRN